MARRSVSVLLGKSRRSRFPSVLLQPLGHLSAFRIIELRAAWTRLSHTPGPSKSGAHDRRLHVGIQPEQIVRVVRILHRDQPVIVRSVRGSDPFWTIVAG